MAMPHRVRPVSPVSSNARMRLRTPASKVKWRERWSRRRAARAHASERVVTARLARTVTITTALLTTLAGITGTIATAVISYKNAASQLAGEREKSTVEFLRKQRQEAYKDFGSEINATYVALNNANHFFWPSNPPPTLEDFNRVHDDLSSHAAKLSEDVMNLDLVASEDVCTAANRNYTKFIDVANRLR